MTYLIIAAAVLTLVARKAKSNARRLLDEARNEVANRPVTGRPMTEGRFFR